MLGVLVVEQGLPAGAERPRQAAGNGQRSDSERLILRPRQWAMDSVPQLGEGDTQSVINSQLVDNSDVVIALFYNRLGTPTDRAISGTAEEIVRSVRQGKPVHLYFSQKRMPANVYLQEVEAVRKFKAVMQNEGLVDTFRSEKELSEKTGRAIEFDVRTITARSQRDSSAGNSSTGNHDHTAFPPKDSRCLILAPRLLAQLIRHFQSHDTSSLDTL